MKQIVEIEVHFSAVEEMRTAIKETNKNYHTYIEIIKEFENPSKLNKNTIFKLASKEPEDFYYLGIAFANLNSKNFSA